MARQNVALCLLLATLICFFLQREKEAGLYVRCIQDTQQILQIDLTKSGLKVFGSPRRFNHTAPQIHQEPIEDP